jgi:hypothetical protein
MKKSIIVSLIALLLTSGCASMSQGQKTALGAAALIGVAAVLIHNIDDDDDDHKHHRHGRECRCDRCRHSH